MSKSLVTQQPEPGAWDHAHSIVKGLVSTIPAVGGVASEVFSIIVAPPLAKRQEAWIEDVVQALVDLQGKVEGFKLEDLSNNEPFITTVMHATQSALRNHQTEKLEALRNAVLNSALPNPPEEDLQQIFINYVDELTTWHLRVLKLFDNPPKWAEENNKPYPTSWHMGGTYQVVAHAYPELAANEELARRIYADLDVRGLATIPYNTTMSVQGIFASRTSSLGKRFIQFISTPPPLAAA
jgi:hypothetical protein